MYRTLIVSFLWIGVMLMGCEHPSVLNTSFYYWKTVYQHDSTELSTLQALHSPSLYVRIMDIDRADGTPMPVPISPIRFKDPIPESVDIVPVVFVVHSIFNKMDDEQIVLLATKVLDFVAAKVEQGGKLDYQELQIDCDWTVGSRDAYFKFLKALQQLSSFKDKTLSVTLRLHQVRDIKKSGIPPVDKALLMCYNMGNLRQYGDHNSIFDMRQMEIYLKDHLKDYPLKMDIALPLFSWKVVFRNKQYVGISKRLADEQLTDTLLFSQVPHSPLYKLKSDMSNLGLRSGDIVRHEQTNMLDLQKASKFLLRYLPDHDFNLVFYHLDKSILSNFSNDDLQEISDHF